MIIAIFPNMNKPETAEVAQRISKLLASNHVTVVTEDENSAELNIAPLSSIDPKKVDYVITLGGDGTILRLIHRHPEITAPIMPINMGNLGFMADITIDEITSSIDCLLAGDFTIQSRITMEGAVGSTKRLAVNDIVVHRSTIPCLIDLAIYVDDIYLNTFSADGLIIATPSGSTAYSLSAGGPIVSPELNAFVLTPICPHTISNRPIVLLPKNNIRVEYLNNEKPIDIIFDGFPSTTLSKGSSLIITQSPRSFKLISLPGHDYFATLRSKLGWSGKLRA